MLRALIFFTLLVAYGCAVPQFKFQDGPPAPGRPTLPNQQSPPPPPPPLPARSPSANRQKGSAGGTFEAKGGSGEDRLFPLNWIFDSNCPDDRPPFANGRWILVDADSCPAAFVGDSFSNHGAFCRYGGDLAEAYKGETTWMYEGSRDLYCYNMPYLLCPALEKCKN